MSLSPVSASPAGAAHAAAPRRRSKERAARGRAIVGSPHATRGPSPRRRDSRPGVGEGSPALPPGARGLQPSEVSKRDEPGGAEDRRDDRDREAGAEVLGEP